MVALANTLYEAMNFGYELHMLPFALGATLFYCLFYKSGFLPRGLSLLGIAAAPMALIGSLLGLLGYDLPLILYAIVFLPNLPFELGTGLWLMVKGLKEGSETM